MGVILGWIIFSLIVGFIGSGRKIGFWGAFFLSILLSPLIGVIIALVSKDKEEEAYKEKVLNNLSQTSSTPIKSIAEELERLKKLREDNTITEEEYQALKKKTINS